MEHAQKSASKIQMRLCAAPLAFGMPIRMHKTLSPNFVVSLLWVLLVNKNVLSRPVWQIRDAGHKRFILLAESHLRALISCTHCVRHTPQMTA